MTKLRSINLGIVGFGRMGARIAEAAERNGYTISAVLDPDENPYGLGLRPQERAVHVRNAAELWQRPIDILSIASYGPTHIPYLLEGIKQGIQRFVVEKPYATGVAQALESKKISEKAGARVIVNHGRRYCPNYKRLESLIGSEEFGDLRAVSVSFGAGGLGCMGIHLLELFNRFLGGLPISVSARAAQETPPNPRGQEFDDKGVYGVLYYPNGRRAFIDCGDDTGTPMTIEFRFSLGRVLIPNEAVPWSLFQRHMKNRSEPLTLFSLPLEEIYHKDFVSFDMIDMAQATLSDAASNSPPISGVETAINALIAFAALRESAEKKRDVSLPLSNKTIEREYSIP